MAMYYITWRERPVTVHQMMYLQGDETFINAKTDRFIFSHVRQECLKEFHRTFGFHWNRRNKVIGLHKFDQHLRVIQDATNATEWRELRKKKIEWKRTEAKVRRSRLY